VHVIGGQLASLDHAARAAVPVASGKLKDSAPADTVHLVLQNLPFAVHVVSGMSDVNILLVTEPFEPLDGLYRLLIGSPMVSGLR